jgi:hypothetical protein
VYALKRRERFEKFYIQPRLFVDLPADAFGDGLPQVEFASGAYPAALPKAAPFPVMFYEEQLIVPVENYGPNSDYDVPGVIHRP